MTPKSLPREITSYDLLKTLALVLMIIDHVGYFFYPDDMWLRAAGRLSAPIWLFLIGFARSRDLSPRIWISILILEASSFAVGLPLLPVNILATILACRMMLDPLMERIAIRPQSLYPVMAIFFLLTIPSAAVLEYGSAAMGFVMLGYMVRNREALPFDKFQILQFAIVAGAMHGVYQVFVFFGFDMAQKIFAMAGIMGVTLALLRFRPVTYAVRLPRAVRGLIQLCGRRTLELYVLHLLIFKFAALALGYDGYGLFDLRIFSL